MPSFLQPSMTDTLPTLLTLRQNVVIVESKVALQPGQNFGDQQPLVPEKKIQFRLQFKLGKLLNPREALSSLPFEQRYFCIQQKEQMRKMQLLRLLKGR